MRQLCSFNGLAAFADTFQYRSEFEDAGFQTYAVNVGKFTSNWHRACETYAQLKGTRVDYGVCHAREFGHLRYGVDYTGQAMYPEWDENHKVHLLGHSMGGQTIRTLERLLREGSGCPEDNSPLFQGGKNWITSLTTLSAPLDGTTLIGILDAFQVLDLLKNLICCHRWSN